jgi:hypothetical protein
MPHTLINDKGQPYQVSSFEMTIIEEDDGILVTGLPGWLCPVLFETDTGIDGLELHEAQEVTRVDGYSHKVDISAFHGIGLEDAITKYLKE